MQTVYAAECATCNLVAWTRDSSRTFLGMIPIEMDNTVWLKSKFDVLGQEESQLGIGESIHFAPVSLQTFARPSPAHVHAERGRYVNYVDLWMYMYTGGQYKLEVPHCWSMSSSLHLRSCCGSTSASGWTSALDASVQTHRSSFLHWSQVQESSDPPSHSGDLGPLCQ